MLVSPSADTAAGFGFRDETAERIGTYSQRLAAVSAHTPLEAIESYEATSSITLLGNTIPKKSN